MTLNSHRTNSRIRRKTPKRTSHTRTNSSYTRELNRTAASPGRAQIRRINFHQKKKNTSLFDLALVSLIILPWYSALACAGLGSEYQDGAE